MMCYERLDEQRLLREAACFRICIFESTRQSRYMPFHSMESGRVLISDNEA